METLVYEVSQQEGAGVMCVSTPFPRAVVIACRLLVVLIALAAGQQNVASQSGSSSTPIVALRSLSPDALSRLVIQGSVTRTGNPLYVQDRSGGIEVRLPAEAPVRIGDQVVVAGEATATRYSYRIAATSMRLLQARAPTPPLAVTPMMAASGRYDGILVDTEASLVSVLSNADSSTTLVLHSVGQAFTVNVAHPTDFVRKLKLGSMLRVRGVCVMNESSSEPAVAFHLLVRSAQDITVMAGPPFWTRRNVLPVAAVCLACSLLALLLQRRFERWRFQLVLEERTRLAHDLHDTLAQSFTGIGFQLHAIRSVLRRQSSAPDVQKHLDVALSMVSDSHQEARRAIAMLRPAVSNENELMQQLQDQAKVLTRGGAMHVRTSVSGVHRPLPSRVTQALLGIGHEAITNAVRHASASTITLVLNFTGDAVQLTIQDDGAGFPVEGDHPQGIGLHGMRTRAISCGGRLEVSSSAGRGCTVVAEVPLRFRWRRFTLARKGPIDAYQ